MRKKFSMLALIVLLVFQTMLTPIAATAQGLEVQGNNDPNVAEDVNVGEEGEGSENGETDPAETESEDADEQEPADDPTDPDNADNQGDSAGNGDGDVTNDDTTGEDSAADEGTDGNDEDESVDADVKEETVEKIEATASDVAPLAITSNPVNGFTFEINENNEWRTIDNGATVTIDPETISATQLNYNLVFDNDLDFIGPGETYTLQLPDVVSPVPTTNPVVLVEEFNISYTIDASGLVTISFPDGWETNDNRELNINLQQNFNKEIFTENVEQEIHIPYTDSEGYTATLVGRPDLIDGSDYKQGLKTYIVDADGNIVTDNTNVQANRADWKVRVNDQLGVYESAIVTDTLNGGHILDTDSVKIYRVNRNKLTGEPIGERVDVTDEFTANPENGGFSIDFGAIDDTYEIEYTTIIDQVDPGSENTIIDNLAEITYDGMTHEHEDNFELEWPLGSEPIIKNGSVDPNDPSKILWTVYYNYEKDNLGNVTFIDKLSLGEVDPTTLEVYEVPNPQPGNLDPWAGGATSAFKPEATTDAEGNMTFSIPESDGKAYYITFESTVPGGLVDQDVTNTIDDENPNTPPGEDTVTVTTPLGGATKDGNVVYEDGVPYILWTVTFNQNKVAYDGFSFSDSFDTSLLTLDMDSFVLDPETDFSVTPSEDGFNFTLNGTSEREVYTLTYKTTYTDAGLEATNVTNKVDLGWDSDGVGPSEEVGHPVAGIKKEASYVTGEDSDGKARQEIEWLVAFNTNHLVLEDPVLSDRFSPAELEIVPDSFEFYTSDGEVEGSLYTYRDVPADTETNTKGYDIEFVGKTEPTTYYVKYRTTIPALNTGANNTATLVWQGNSEKDNANVPIGANEPGASKNGTVERAEDGSSKQINWEIRFNQNERIIHDLVITDTYSPTDAVLVDEIAIHKADGTPLVQGSDGDYVISEPFGEGGFTIEFNDQTEPVEYVLTYSTEYNAYSDNIDAKNEAVVKFLGGEHTISKTITPVVLNVEKQSTGVDTSSKPAVISWAITSNTNLKTLKDAILVDTIEDDQLFVDGSMKLNDEEVEPTWDGTEFTVELPDGANSHVLTYETQIVSYPSNYGSNHDEYYNKVDLINYSNDEDSIKETVSDDATARYYQDGGNNNPGKSGEQDPETDLIVWTATVNPDAQPIKNASIRDILDTNQVYYQDADGNYDLVVERLSGENAGVVSSSEYDVEYTEVNDIPQFVLTFNDSEINDTYTLSYSTSLRDEIVGQKEVSNTIQVIGYDSDTVIEQVEKSTTSAKWYFGGSGSSQTLNLKVVKIDADDNTIPLQNVKFQLQDGRGGETQTFTTDKNGEIDVDGLRAGRYTLTETEPLPGYQGMDPIYFYLGYGENESAVIDLTNSSWATDDLQRLESAEISLVNEKIKVPVTATKVWEGGQENNRPTVYFQLYRQVDEGEAETVPDAEIKELAQGTTSVTWDNQVAFDNAGNEYTFSVQEVDAEGNDFEPTGYTKVEDGLTVTNTISPIEISISKVWNDADNQDGLRPKSVTANLLADGEQIDTIELSEENEWGHVFENLPVYDNGEEISYTITENAVEHYSTEIVGGVITNNYTPQETSVTVTKNWQDSNNQDGKRPESIEVQLTADGVDTEHRAVLSEENNWTATWSGLALNSDGTAIDYSVEEITAVDGYEVVVDDTDHGNIILTNSYEPVVTDLTVNKVWDDADNQDGIRSESVTVKLFADGDDTGQEVQLNEDNNWQADFTDLDVYVAGEEIVYTIEEVAVEGYETSISGTSADGFVITNSYTPEVIRLEGTKTWDDADNQDGVRPESITVRLQANGEEVDVIEVTAETEWAFEFTNLPRFADGEEINYTIQEDDVEEYSTEIDGFDITNSYTPGQTSINVVKAWEDANNQDGIRSESITVKLLADGEETDQERELSEDNNWQADFTELNVYADGEAIVYTVEEVVVEGYETSISGTSVGGFVITNSYTPELIDVEGTKTWDDADNQDGARPELITVRLLANGEEIDDVEVTEEDDWNFSFTDLPKFENGEEINYTVQEDEVEDYSTEINGFDITNSYTPGQTSINVVKAWEDAENKNGDRPDSITVNLLADGEATGQEVELNADNNWQADFTDLDVNKDGKAIVYTVEEVAVDEYRTEITGDSGAGFVITNTLKTYAIGDYTWIDSNKDGIQDEDEEVLEGVIVELYDESGENKLAETTTDENGLYIFDELPAGKYTVKFTLTDEQKEKYVFTKQNADENSTKDSDADPETGWTTVIELNDENEHLTKDYKDQGFKATEGIDPTWDAGVIEKTPITPIEPAKTKVSVEKVWIGEAQDEVTINLLADGEKVDSVELLEENDWKHTFTDLQTVHEITDEKAIEYTVEEVKVDGYNTEITGNAKEGFIITNTQKTYAIGDYTWIDSNKDGIQDEDEEVLPGVKVELFDEDGNKIAETKTDKNGLYIFDELPAGKYKVKFTLTKEQAKKYEFTKQNAGDDSTVDSDADKNGWTIEFTLDDANEHLTKDYTNQDFKATEGIDPTWDAGVIVKVTPEDPEEPQVPENPKDPEEPELGGDGGEKDPEDPTETDLGGAGEDGDVEAGGGTGQTVPATATNIYNLALIGFGLMLLGLIIFLARRKRIE